MGKATARWINFDVQTLQGTTTLSVYLDSVGGLEKTASGIRIKASGITNDMLAGSIALTKLAEAVIQADGGQDFTADQSMGGNRLTNVGQASAQTDAINLSQLQSAVTGLDFQPDVLNIQADATLDPGSSPNIGDRYIITDSGSLHVNFGTISGIEDGDIIEYSGSVFEVSYDVSVQGEGALVWDQAGDAFVRWDGTSWDVFGGLSGVTAGDGLSKSGNTMNVVVNDFIGAGLENDGANNIRIASSAAGNGLTGGGGSALSVDPDDTTGGDVAPVSVTGDGVGLDVTDLDGDHLGVDFTPSNYTPSDTPTEAADVDDLAAHLKGIDNALSGASSNQHTTITIEITSGIVTTGYTTLSPAPLSVNAVQVNPVGGPAQVNKQGLGTAAITPDFDVLNANELHINNNATATGLSGVIAEGDYLVVTYPTS